MTVELCFALDASSQFARADGNIAASIGLMKAAGVFGFLAGLLGFYTVAHYLCLNVLPFDVPMGDTSAWLERHRQRKVKESMDLTAERSLG